ERTAILLHLIDGTQEDVVAAYHTIRHELQEYDADLAAKNEILALNKIDALTPEEITEKQNALEQASGKKVLTVSAASQTNMRPLLFALLHEIKQQRRTEYEESESTHDTGYDPTDRTHYS